MPYVLSLSVQLTVAGWKVKIWDAEYPREAPHATIIRSDEKWRINLRTGEFMDRQPAPKRVDRKVVAAIRDPVNWSRLQAEWNAIHPINPV